MYLDWLTFDRPVTREYAAERAELCAEMGADVHCYGIQVGGTMIYPSRVCGQSPSLDFDLLAALVEENHRRGIKFVPGWLGTLPGNAKAALEHPDWITCAPRHGRRATVQLTCMCYNSPFREHQAEQVREVLTDYDVDGIYFDQIMTGCFCDYCQRDFRLMYGYALPEDDAMEERHMSEATLYNEAEWVQKGLVSPEAARDLIDFVDRKTEAWLINIRRIIAETRPEAKLCCSHLSGRRAPLARKYCDVIAAEQIRTNTNEIRLLSMEREVSAAYARKMMWEGVKYDNYAWRSRPAVHVEVQMAEAAANGAKPWLRDQNALDLDPPSKRARVTGAMKAVSQVVRESVSARPIRYAGLVHTFRDTSDEHFRSFSGFYRLLSEEHLPVEIIPLVDLPSATLTGLKLLILPSVRDLSGDAAEAVKRFLDEGGAVLATDVSVCQGAAEPGAMARLLGITPESIWTNQRTVIPANPDIPIATQHPSDFYYARVRDDVHPLTSGIEGIQMDFTAPYVQVDAGDNQVLADVLAFDQEALMANPFSRRIPRAGKPQHPLLIVGERPWRMAYFAAAVGALGARGACEELDDLLVRAVRWAGGQPPIDCENIPHTVRVVARTKGDRLFLHLNNLPDNVVPDCHIRKVVPVQDLVVRIGPVSGQIGEIRAARGGDVSCKIKNNTLHIRLLRLDVFEIITMTGVSVGLGAGVS